MSCREAIINPNCKYRGSMTNFKVYGYLYTHPCPRGGGEGVERGRGSFITFLSLNDEKLLKSVALIVTLKEIISQTGLVSLSLKTCVFKNVRF